MSLCCSQASQASLMNMNTNSSDSSAATLVVFCKRPHPGQGKQRISAALGARLTAELAGLLLDTALEDAADWPGPVVIAPAAEADRDWAAALPGRHSVCCQPDGNLGERLNGVDRQLRDGGATCLIYIGSDAPLLNPAYFAAARQALMSNDVVLGPAEDGGVVLMGSRQGWPELAGLPWSGQKLGESLELICRASGQTVKYLPASYDIDFAHDLPRLFTDLATDERPARRRLSAWLAANRLNRTAADDAHESRS